MDFDHLLLVRLASSLIILAVQLSLKLINQLLATLLLLSEFLGGVGGVADVDQVAGLAVCEKNKINSVEGW